MSLEQRATANPIAASERIKAIDVLRGFALLGILPVNMIAFAHVGAAYQNPSVAGGYDGINYLVWLVTHFIFENKMVTIFSTLFGVGLFIQVSRAEARRGRVGSARGLYFRRVGWLLLFGLLHAYLFWFGDVLTYYAIIGMLVYWLRRLPPRWLISLGVLLLAIGSLVILGVAFFISAADTYVKSHPELVKEVREMKELHEQFNPPAVKIEEEARQVREAGFFQLAMRRAVSTFQFQTMGMLIVVIWRFTGLMLIGIAMYKLGAFTLEWSNARYWRWAIIGLGAGIAMTIMAILKHHQVADFSDALRLMATWDYYSTLFFAAGYFAIVMLMVKYRWLTGLQDRLAAVGQLAFTNYLMQTLICTSIFHGWGFAQFGLWPRYAMFLLVLCIWALQLAISPIWLRHYRFGPGEWLWRSLTYLKWQPMRRE